MKIISQLSEAQEQQIPFYIKEWKDKYLLTAPINPTIFEQGIQDIHEEVGLEAPREFLYYPSPAAMWREFEVWKSKITRVTTQFWSYQIPLCDPSSMHRRWRPGNTRSVFNFKAKRYSPGPNLALHETEDSDETSGTVIQKELHDKIWKRFDFQMLFDLTFVSTHGCNDYEGCGDHLNDRADEESPSNPLYYDHFCFLGPEYWLLRELACINFCHRVLGINRNERLYSGLEAIVEGGSFCGVFGHLCVACERPYKIEHDDNIFTLIYPDGEVLTNRDWKQK